MLSQKKLAELTDSELEEKLSLQDSIKDLENEISNISSKNLEKKYLLDSGLLIFQYYENMDRIAQGGNFQSEQNHNPGNILNFFHNSAKVSFLTITTNENQKIAGHEGVETHVDITSINGESITKEKKS